MQVQRLFEIVYILLQKKHSTAKELAEHFEVSTRTIYRDLDTLSMAGIPIYTNKGSQGGIFLMEHYTLHRTMISEEEQQHVLSALQSYQLTNHDEIDPLLTKLSAQFRKEQIHWIDVDFKDWGGDKDSDTFSTIKQAIFQRICISFTYYNSYGQKKQRTIEPFRLLFKGQAWYVIGYCLEKQDQRMFKLYRMQDITLTKQKCEHSIDEQAITKSYTTSVNDMVHIKAHIDASCAFRVYDEYTPACYEVLEDGSFILHITFPRGEWVFNYLMGFGDALQVISPQEIKDEILRRYHHVLLRYEENTYED